MTDELPSESWYESETTTQERLPDVRVGEQGQRVGPGVSEERERE